MVSELARRGDVALISGDNDNERDRFAKLFGKSVHFYKTPLEKLGFIEELQRTGRTVMMVGDGLNDAGALRQSDVGVAVVENMGAFSPASDAIMAADCIPSLAGIVRFSRGTVKVIRFSFLLSSIYNVVGITIAARALLSPVVCAVLMPLSSISVIAFACGAVAWIGGGLRMRTHRRLSEDQRNSALMGATGDSAVVPIFRVAADEDIRAPKAEGAI